MKIEEFDFPMQLDIQINNKKTNKQITYNMSIDPKTGEFCGIYYASKAATWKCYMKKYQGKTTYDRVWCDDKEYLIYCFNKGWIKHPEIKKFIQKNIDFMEEVKHKHWLSCNSNKLNFIAKWWKKILEKKYNSPTTFGIKSVRLIKTKASRARPRRNVLAQIRYRKGRCVSLKAYRKKMRENLEAAKKFAERKKREEEEERKNRPRSYSSDKDDYYTGGMFSRCPTIGPWD